MKIKIFLVSAFMLLFSMSCTKWLDVTPKDTIAEEDLFKVGTGYRNALNGVYKQMSSSSLYGRELSWGMVDVLAQTYQRSYISQYNAYGMFANKYDYISPETKECIEGVWKKAYNSIANCNNILGRIEAEPNSKFVDGSLEKDLIQGETFALRAFLHFDILRLFAPAPISDDEGAYIPYYETYPSFGEPNRPVKYVLEKVIEDLKRAQKLLAKFDTMDVVHKQWLEDDVRFQGKNYRNVQMPENVFFAYRGYRMNYLAITAILARVYNYAGEHDLAAIEATKITDFESAYDNGALFRYTEYSEIDGNRKLSDDLIFTLSDNKLYDNYKTYYPGVGDQNWRLFFNDDYGGLFSDGGDGRLKLLDKIDYNTTSNKNRVPIVNTDMSEIVADMLPIVRLSEMHLIIAEKYAADGDFSAAADAIDVVRAGRNCAKGSLKITDMKSFVSNLILEARREYFGEGQLFYYLKKYNTRPSGMSNVKSFVLPRPDSEEVN